MIIVFKTSATKKQISHVKERVVEFGLKPHIIFGEERTVIACVGNDRDKTHLQQLESLEYVENILPILKPFKLASNETIKRTIVKIGNIAFGSNQFIVIAGPCSVESQKQIVSIAEHLKKSGAHMLRGGAFKPRTSPYSFQGLEEEGLKYLALAREKSGLPFVTEIINPVDVKLVSDYADMLQIGARNMQNFALLKEVGKQKKPILLKRGMSSTYKEFLMSAEYIMSMGNYNVVLCERGIRTFEDYTRNTFDLTAVPALKELSHLPVIVDPSHGTGVRSLIPTMSKAAIPVGADGIILEVHPNPELAFSDGAQSLKLNQFDSLMAEFKRYAPLEKRVI